MPRLVSSRLLAACALALVLSISLAASSAAASGVTASLRVVGRGNRVLTEQTLRTGTARLKTSKRATCFGAGTGGSGRSVTVKGPTALGLLSQAASKTAALRPLLLTDAFEFGLGICGVGKSVVRGKASWYLKVNHKGAQVGGDHYKLRPGDEVLWDYAPSYQYPNELALEAPEAAGPGIPFQVRVLSYDERGKRKPVRGARVTDASAPTGANGVATVTLMAPTSLRATHGAEIPSAAEEVCVGDLFCPASGSR
jgi:hypothetical protein